MDSLGIINPFYQEKTFWSSGIGPKEYGLYLANKRKKHTPKQTNKKKNFKKH